MAQRGGQKISVIFSLFWWVTILGSCILFLFARAHRWVEGVTIDDTLSLLLGAFPFFFFAFVSPRLARFGSAPASFYITSWILTLIAFLVIRLSHLAGAYLDFPFVERSALTRLVVSLAYATLGTLASALFFVGHFRAKHVPKLPPLMLAWLFNAIYMWVSIFLLPPQLSSS